MRLSFCVRNSGDSKDALLAKAWSLNSKLAHVLVFVSEIGPEIESECSQIVPALLNESARLTRISSNK
jgi:hypothetical protein